MDILLFGKPGAGKGTQAPMLAESLGAATLATGDVLRGAVREGTPLGKKAKEYMDRGDLVPDDVILGIVGEALASKAYAKGAILDGVVRTVPQAEGLERVLRTSGRTVCEKCQTPYTGRNTGDTCDKCGGTLVRRKDDEPDAVRNRLKVYERQTAPVFDWYRRNGTRIVTVDAVGTVEEVTQRARQALGR